MRANRIQLPDVDLYCHPEVEEVGGRGTDYLTSPIFSAHALGHVEPMTSQES
jgi:hypothetical protein